MNTKKKTFKMALKHHEYYEKISGKARVCAVVLRLLFEFPEKMPAIIWLTVSKKRFVGCYEASWTGCKVKLDGEYHWLQSATDYPLKKLLGGPGRFFFKIEYEVK